jgi:hypothetical protein
MQDGIITILRMFLFSEHLKMIALVCLVAFLGNFFGGLIHSIVLAYSGPQPERPMTERLSFRLVLMVDLFLVVYAIYYHAVLVRTIELVQVFYWSFALIVGPVLALLGAQITYVLFTKEIERNKKRWRQHEMQQRADALSRAERVAEATLAARRGRRRNTR